MRTTVEPLEGNRVKLMVEVDEAEFERALDAAFRRIAREARIPGFRPGKAPRRLLEARIGTEIAREEALRESLPGYYEQALTESSVDAIASPEIDITAGKDAGPVAFDAVVEVRPKVSVPGYASLRVTIPDPRVSDEEVDAQLERLRAQFGELEVVNRPALDGDHVTIDISGSLGGEAMEGLTADDYLYEVGSEAIVADVDRHLRGAKVGDILVFDVEHPDVGEHRRIAMRVLVKEIKQKVLPDIDDEWANEASEFETVAELRDHLRARLAEIKPAQSRAALEDGTLAALVELVDEEPPASLVDAELERQVQQLAFRLQSQGVSLEDYLEASGRSGEELTDQLRERAGNAVVADLGLRAVAEAESIEVSDDDLDAEIHRLAHQVGEKPAALRRRFERADGLGAVRSDVEKSKALTWLIDHAEIVDEEGRPIDRADLDAPGDHVAGDGDARSTGDEDESDHPDHEPPATSEEQSA
ncbi:MAG TPA: trigger factor [Acidimicrobiales bacterium]|nr:trigger factor [Acidimicrobiales bacterium]